MKEGGPRLAGAMAKIPRRGLLKTSRLFVLSCSKLLSRVELFQEHRRWGALPQSKALPSLKVESVTLDPEKRLRIGYVSPDFRDHPVAAFYEPVLKARDKRAFEIFCFDTSPAVEDAVTARLKRSADVWQCVTDMGDQALAETIRKSQIDILVDLSGHTKWNRLSMFALKPAPIQVTWLGYLNTTGLTAMDYRITDGYLDPAGKTEHLHTERLCRLPLHSCFLPSPQ